MQSDSEQDQKGRTKVKQCNAMAKRGFREKERVGSTSQISKRAVKGAMK